MTIGRSPLVASCGLHRHFEGNVPRSLISSLELHKTTHCTEYVVTLLADHPMLTGDLPHGLTRQWYILLPIVVFIY